MRFMMLVKASKESETGILPDEKVLGDMAKFNEEMVKAGVMLAGDGLQAELEGSPRPVLEGQAHASSTDRSRKPRSSSPATG